MENKNRKGLVLSIIAVLALIVVVAGATFAYFAASVSGNNNVRAESYEFAVTLGVSKIAPTEATIDKLIPLTEGDISDAVTGGGNPAKPCVDDNGYAACVIYDLTFNNSGSAAVTMDGTLTPTSNTFNQGQLWYRASATNSGSAFASATATQLVSSAVTTGLTSISVPTGISHLYLLLYIKNDTSADQPNDKGKTFIGTVAFTDTTSGAHLEATFS